MYSNFNHYKIGIVLFFFFIEICILPLTISIETVPSYSEDIFTADVSYSNSCVVSPELSDLQIDYLALGGVAAATTVTVSAVADDEIEDMHEYVEVNNTVTSGDPTFNFARKVFVDVRDKRRCGEIGTTYNPWDLTGPGGARDCYVDFYDFAAFAQQWLQCTDPADPGCI